MESCNCSRYMCRNAIRVGKLHIPYSACFIQNISITPGCRSSTDLLQKWRWSKNDKKLESSISAEVSRPSPACRGHTNVLLKIRRPNQTEPTGSQIGNFHKDLAPFCYSAAPLCDSCGTTIPPNDTNWAAQNLDIYSRFTRLKKFPRRSLSQSLCVRGRETCALRTIARDTADCVASCKD